MKSKTTALIAAMSMAAAALALSVPAAAQGARSCGSFGYWKAGDQCRNNAGKICTVKGIVNKKTQLSCS